MINNNNNIEKATLIILDSYVNRKKSYFNVLYMPHISYSTLPRGSVSFPSIPKTISLGFILFFYVITIQHL